MWPAGTAWSPIRGVVGLGAGVSPGYQAGTPSVGAAAPAGWRPGTGAGSHGRLGIGPGAREWRVMEVRPPTGSIPDAPGSYQFLDADGRVLYVGKAKSLRHRLPNYWQDPARPAGPDGPDGGPGRPRRVGRGGDRGRGAHARARPHPDPPAAVQRPAEGRQELPVAGRHRSASEWPRPAVVRGRKRKGVRYFGPYGHVGALRETLDLLLRSFPVRTCSDTKFRRHQRLGRPCLLYDIERCSGPCVGAVDHDRYGAMVEDLMRFLSGDTAPVVAGLERRDGEAADALEFERAARLRDRLTAVRKAAETQQMVSERPEDLDVIGIAEDELEAAVQVFHVRRGRVVGRQRLRGRQGGGPDPGPSSSAGARAALRDAPGRPRCPGGCWSPRCPTSPGVLGDWLAGAAGRAGRAGGAPAGRQAEPAGDGDPQRRGGPGPAPAAPGLGPQQPLEGPDRAAGGARTCAEAPLRIECYDMSHLQGTDYVGSMVVFEDGLAKKSDYRRFKVRTVAGNDDYAAMEEVLTRRLSAWWPSAGARATGGRPPPPTRRATARRRAAPGRPTALRLPAPAAPARRGQGAVGRGGAGGRDAWGWPARSSWPPWPSSSRRSTGPGRTEPVRIPRGSEALYLLQRVRDEAHRFAITYHRQRRGTRMTASALDGVPGARARPGGAACSGSWAACGRCGRPRSRTCAPCPGCPTRWPTPVFERASTGRRAGRRRPGARVRRARGGQTGARMSEFLVVTGMSAPAVPRRRATLEDLGWFVIDNLPAVADHQGGRAGRAARVGDRAGGPGRRPGRGGAPRGRVARSSRPSSRPATGCGCCSSTPPTRCWCGASRGPAAATPWPPGAWRSRSPTSAGCSSPCATGPTSCSTPASSTSTSCAPGSSSSSGTPRGAEGHMQTSIVSFGYKHGVPLDVDLLFDCRFLPNPYWVEALRPLSGLDGPVRDYVLGQPETVDFLAKVDDLLTMLVPAFVREGKSYLTVAMGCTGGRHRSVALAEALAERLAVPRRGVDLGLPPGRRPVTAGPGRPPGGGGGRRPRDGGHPAGGPPLRRRDHRRRLGGRRRRLERPAPRAARRGGPGRHAQVPGGPGRRPPRCWPGPSSTASRTASWPGTPWATWSWPAWSRRPATWWPGSTRRPGCSGRWAGSCRPPPSRWCSRPRPTRARWPGRWRWPPPARSGGSRWSRRDAEPAARGGGRPQAADQVVIGRGRCTRASWPPWRSRGIAEALPATAAQRVYVCNLRPQIPETAGYDVAAHVAALRQHGVEVDVVLVRQLDRAWSSARRTARWSTGPWPVPTAWSTTLTDWRKRWRHLLA